MAQKAGPLPAEKVIPVAVMIVAYLLFIFATIATRNFLPFWQYGLGLAILFVIGWLLLQKPTPAGQAGPARDYLDWLKTPWWKLAIAIMAMGFLGSGIYFGIMEVPNKVYSAEELLQHEISGNGKVINKELVCSGDCRIVILNPKNIGKIILAPGTEPFQAMDIYVGQHYLVQYSQGDLKQFGGTVCGYAIRGVYHRAMIYYNHNGQWLGAVQTCSPVPVAPGMAPENLYFGTSWLRALVPEGEDPHVYLGDKPLSTSGINIDRQILLGGNIILTGQNMTIKELRLIFI